MMKAAVLYEPNSPLVVEEVELRGPEPRGEDDRVLDNRR